METRYLGRQNIAVGVTATAIFNGVSGASQVIYKVFGAAGAVASQVAKISVDGGTTLIASPGNLQAGGTTAGILSGTAANPGYVGTICGIVGGGSTSFAPIPFPLVAAELTVTTGSGTATVDGWACFPWGTDPQASQKSMAGGANLM